MWGGIKGVLGALFSGELFNGDSNQVAQEQAPPAKSPKPPEAERPEHPVRHRPAPLPAPSVIMNLLSDGFKYPETKAELLRILSGQEYKNERAWLKTSPQENIDRLLADVQRMRAYDEANNRQARTQADSAKLAEFRGEADRKREAAEAEKARREKGQLDIATAVAAGVIVGLEADRRNRGL